MNFQFFRLFGLSVFVFQSSFFGSPVPSSQIPVFRFFTFFVCESPNRNLVNRKLSNCVSSIRRSGGFNLLLVGSNNVQLGRYFLNLCGQCGRKHFHFRSGRPKPCITTQLADGSVVDPAIRPMSPLGRFEQVVLGSSQSQTCAPNDTWAGRVETARSSFAGPTNVIDVAADPTKSSPYLVDHVRRCTDPIPVHALRQSASMSGDGLDWTELDPDLQAWSTRRDAFVGFALRLSGEESSGLGDPDRGRPAVRRLSSISRVGAFVEAQYVVVVSVLFLTAVLVYG